MFNNTVVVVSGHYVCEAFQNFYDIEGIGSPGTVNGEYLTQNSWYNNRVQCDNGGVDEKYCTEEKEDHEEMFQCQIFGNISISRVCDRKCDCLNCDDEFNCNGYTYHYWYKCYNSSDVIHSYNICNNIKDCKHGDDESICGNVTTCVTESRSPRPNMLANYSRCTPWV